MVHFERISSQSVSLQESLNVGKHTEQIIFVKESPDNLAIANRIVQDVPEVIFKTDKRLFKVFGHFAVFNDRVLRDVGIPGHVLMVTSS